MKHNRSLPTSFLTAASVGLLAVAGPAFGDDAKPEAKPAAKPEEKAAAPSGEHTVARGNLSATVEVPAVVVADRALELSLSPKAWADLTVVRAVAHGAKVRKGEVLLVVETDQLAEQIGDLEAAQAAARLNLKQGEEALRNLEVTTPVQLEAAATAKAKANDDLAYFEKTARKEAEKAVRWGVKSSEQNLEGAEEELDQLTKMYEADDLTEETEEIIVKRARYAVESARQRLDSARVAAERALSTTIPQEHRTLRDGSKAADIAADTAKATLPRALELKRIEMAKAKEDLNKGERKLKELRADLALLDVRAKEDGYVYYGSASDGKWDSGAVVAKKLVAGGKIAPKETFMTLVIGGASRLTATIPEDKLFLLREGSRGTARPAFDPRVRVPARITRIARVPQPGGGFLSQLALDAKEGAAERLVPGMNVKVGFEPVKEKNVLLLPLDAVFEVDGATVAYVKREGGPEPIAIVTGATDGKMIAVKSGLEEGDIILTSRP